MTEETWRQRVARVYRERGTLRAAAEVLGVSHQTVANALEEPHEKRDVRGARRRDVAAMPVIELSAGAFDAWCLRMHDRGWSNFECARRLGCSENSVSKWRREGAARYVGLACAALENGLEVVQ